jgi:hypothetical protein
MCAWLVVACGDDDSDKGSDSPIVSCWVESPDRALQCIEYGVPPEAVDEAREGCTAGGGTVVSSCPTADRLGTCTLEVSSRITLVTHYYSGGLIPDTAEQLCSSSGGSWDPAL